jgi:hypothetical protein
MLNHINKPTYIELANLIKQLADEKFDWYSPDSQVVQDVFAVAERLNSVK